MAKIQVTSSGTNSFLNAARTVFRDSDGLPYVLYNYTDNETIYLEVGNSSTPSSFSTVDTEAETEIAGLSGAIDSADVLHISWINVDGKSSSLRYTSIDLTAGTPVFETVTVIVSDIGGAPTASSLHTAIAVDANDVPHIVYNEFQSIMGDDTYVAMYVNKTGGSWQTPVQVHYQQAINCTALSIAVDLDNLPVIVIKINGTSANVNKGNANDATSFTTYSTNGGEGHVFSDLVVSAIGDMYLVSTETISTKYIGIRKWTYGGSATATRTLSSIVGADAMIISSVPVGEEIYVFYEDLSDNDIKYIVIDISGTPSFSSVNTLETGTFNTAKAKWGFWVDNDSQGTLVSGFIDEYIGNDLAYSLGVSQTYQAVGQSFNAENNSDLIKVKFLLQKILSPTGNVYAKLYEHSGVFGTSSVPTGSALATSDAIDITTITGSIETITFNFSTPYSLVSGTKYVIVVEYSGGDGSNYLLVYADNTSPTHSGNLSRYTGSWAAVSGEDLEFTVIAYERTAPSELDYAFVDEEASPDVWWNVLVLDASQNLTLTAAYATFTLTGFPASGHIKTPAVQASFTLTGYAPTFVRGKKLKATQQTYTLTGFGVDFPTARSIIADQQTYTLTGYDVGLSVGRVLIADQQTYTLTGYDVGLNIGRILTADQQTYTLIGHDVGLSVNRLLTTDQQTYTLTGFATGLSVGRVLIGDQQTYTLTGFATGLKSTRILTATQQTYTLTGFDTGLTKSTNLIADQQTYTLTGFAVNLNKSLNLTATQQTYTLTGFDVGLVVTSGITLTAEYATFTLTGYDVGLTKSLNLIATQQTYTLTGFDINLLAGAFITAEVSYFTLTGYAVDLKRAYSITADQATFVLTGKDVALTFESGQIDYDIVADQATFTLTGYDVGLNVGRSIIGTQQTYTLTGYDVGLLVGRTITATQQTFTLTGYDTGFTKSVNLVGDYQTYTLTGFDVGMRVGPIMPAEQATFVLTGKDVELRKQLILQAVQAAFVLTGYDANLVSSVIVLIAEYASFVLTGYDAGGTLKTIGEIWTGVSEITTEITLESELTIEFDATSEITIELDKTSNIL